jgi:2-isopropylmalate synthase
VVLRSYQLKALEVSEGGSGSLVRVVTEFVDAEGNTWSSVGISTDSNEAGFKALIAGIEYHLFTSNAENKHYKLAA